MSLHNQTQRDKNSSNAFSLGIAGCFWVRFTPKNSSKKLNEEEVEKLFNNYEAKLSGQMVKSLGCSIINMYSMGAFAALGISDKDALSEDLENDPFLNSALQRFTCELYHRFGSFLAPLSGGIIMSRHYLSECNKNGEQERTSGTSGGNEGPATTEQVFTSGNEQKLINFE